MIAFDLSPHGWKTARNFSMVLGLIGSAPQPKTLRHDKSSSVRVLLGALLVTSSKAKFGPNVIVALYLWTVSIQTAGCFTNAIVGINTAGIWATRVAITNPI